MDIRESFRSEVSDELLSSVVRKVIGGTRDAARAMGTGVREGVYTRYVARDLFPIERRARIETYLFDLAVEFPEAVVTTQTNKTSTNYHTRIRVGNTIMTASAVTTPKGLVREADFRNSYAADPQTRFDIDQYQNFSPVAMEQSSKVEFIYGIILYCPATDNRFEIGAIHLGFPNQTCTRYIDCLDLISLFPDTTRKTEVEQIQDQALVELLLDESDIIIPQSGEESPEDQV